MPKPEQTPEPSIEEILASIRRIIADDAPAGAVNVASAEDDQVEHAAAPARRPGNQPGARSEDEVLELTDFMLAEEAPALTLQEPAEPEEFTQSQRYETRDESGLYRDPYDESFARHVSRAEQAKPAPQHSESREEAGGMFSAVMAEVRRFTDSTPAKEPTPPKEQPQAAAPEPQDNWGQPDLEALTSGLSRGAARPVWSARHKETDDRRGVAGAEPQTRRPATSDIAPGRQPDLASPDNWSRGVQMPVPEAGPALPFPPEEEIAPRSKAPSPAAPAQQTSAPVAAASPARLPQSAQQDSIAEAASASRPANQGKAEELADRAVSDFTSDRVGAPAVVADILKGDKPLMDAITSSLASALARETEDADDFEEAPHPEDFADDIFAAGEPAIAAPAEQPVSSQPKGLAVPGIVGLDGGFVEHHPVRAKEAGPVVALADQEMPELPREEPDDILSGANAPSHDRPVYRSTGNPQPVMPTVPAPADRPSSLPVAGRVAVRETVATPAERVQPASGPKSLEDTIKEMLKPLLMQWLDENMPRIVNEALREEMAANGLLPKAREARR